MTIDEFLDKLSETPRDWYIGGDSFGVVETINVLSPRSVTKT